MLRKDDPEFKKLVDGTPSRLMQSGELYRLHAKWFRLPILPNGANLSLLMVEQLRANLNAVSDMPALQGPGRRVWAPRASLHFKSSRLKATRPRHAFADV